MLCDQQHKERWFDFWNKTIGYPEHEKDWLEVVRMHQNPVKATYSVQVMQSYQSPVTDRWIDTPRQRREDLKASGSRPWEGMESERKEAAQKKSYIEAEQDKKLDVAVRTAYAQLPNDKKEQLKKEVVG